MNIVEIIGELTIGTIAIFLLYKFYRRIFGYSWKIENELN